MALLLGRSGCLIDIWAAVVDLVEESPLVLLSLLDGVCNMFKQSIELSTAELIENFFQLLFFVDR